MVTVAKPQKSCPGTGSAPASAVALRPAPGLKTGSRPRMLKPPCAATKRHGVELTFN